MSRRFFANGHITKKNLKKADIAARIELESVSHDFIKAGWEQVVGASGSIRSISNVVQEEGFSDGRITLQAMKKLRSRLLEAEHIDNLNLKGLSDERRPVFVGGFVVLNALFKELNIEEMYISDGAVREGLIYDLLGRIKHEDVREATVQRFAERYSVHMEHANKVAKTAVSLYRQVEKDWKLSNQGNEKLLRWSALLHEIGLTIAHAGYHKHGAYLAENSDMPGFSFQDQQLLAILIRSHRQKIPLLFFDNLPSGQMRSAMRLSIILRLAIILHRNREDVDIPKMDIATGKNSLKVTFPDGWLDEHALTYADLQHEKAMLADAGFVLKTK